MKKEYLTAKVKRSPNVFFNSGVAHISDVEVVLHDMHKTIIEFTHKTELVTLEISGYVPIAPKDKIILIGEYMKLITNFFIAAKQNILVLYYSSEGKLVVAQLWHLESF